MGFACPSVQVPLTAPMCHTGPGPPGGRVQGHTRLSRALAVGRLRQVGEVFVFRGSPGGSCLGGQLWGLQQSACNPSHAFLPQFLFHF